MIKFYLGSVALLFIIAGQAQTTLSLTCDKDNTIYSAFAANSNGSGQYVFIGKNAEQNNNSVQRGLLHFNMGTIPAGAVITAATLTLYANKTAPNATGIVLHKVTTDWGEGVSDAAGNEAQGAAASANDATWSQRFFPGTVWAAAGGDFLATVSSEVTSIPSNIGSATALTLTGAGLVADLQGWVTTPASNFGWLVNSTDETLGASVKRIVSRNSATVAQRPVLSVTYTVNLPVTLKSFSASLNNKQAILQWKTATETNNSHFTIEHSPDGFSFVSIGTVNGSGSSATEQSYSFIHPDLASGKHYYRLAQYDLNGGIKYSQVVLLAINSFAELQIKPNPATSFILVTSSFSLEGSQYYIHSVSGNLVSKGTMKSQQIGVQSLLPGQYWLSIQKLTGESSRQSFMKK